MKLDQKLFAVVLAVSASLGIAACNEDKAASTAADKPAATTMEKAKEMAAKVEDKVEEKVVAAKEKIKDMAEKAAPQIEAAKEKVKDIAAKIEDKVEEKVDAAKEKMKAMADKAGDKIDAAKDAAQPAAKDAAAPAAVAAAAPEAKTAEAAPAAPAAAAAPEAKPAEAAPAAATPEAKPAEAAAPAAKPAEAAPAAAAAAGEDNAAIQASAKEAGATFKDGRYRDKDGHPMPVATKDYKVDWATWQGFRRYHDACHVCHGPNALGSTFAPGLAESLKTMDYETFYGTVVGGRIADRGGTKYVMPAFGEDKNIMCYLDDIYSYIKARSINAEGKGGMPPGRPNGREDISPEAKKAAADCTG